MDPRSVLQGQIDSLARQLTRVEEAVQAPNLDHHLVDRVGASYDQDLTLKRGQLNDLQQAVANDQPLKDGWERLDKLEQDCRRLFDECLAFIQGALARASQVDNGLCLLADALLDDLAIQSDVGWRRFTLIATSEFYGDRERAGLIRIRFPELSLWSLPVVAHEFGHYLGPELRQRQDPGAPYRKPFQELLEQADENGVPSQQTNHTKQWHHLHEHFADLFAVYTLGPAFACCFILTRINPMEASKDGPTHPSHAKRVHSILWMLEWMNQNAGGLTPPYRGVIDLLRAVWQRSLQESGLNVSLANSEISGLEEKLKDLLEILLLTTPSRLAYQRADWRKAEGLANLLMNPSWPPPDLQTGDLSRRDVLNAAWLSRLELDSSSEYRLNDLISRAQEVYRAIPRPGA